MKTNQVLLKYFSLVCIAIGFVSCDFKDLSNAATIYNMVQESENEGQENEAPDELLNSSDESENNLSKSGNTEIDSLLDDYENYVAEYNDYKERISNGDITVIAEAPELLKKVQDTKKKLDNIKVEMTPEQIARMSLIIASL